MLKKITILISLLGILLGLSSCGRTAMPNFYNGYYYMAGGSDCVDWRDIGNTRMMCWDSDGNETGYILPMTDQQLEMYRHSQTMRSNRRQSYNNNDGPIVCNTIGSMTFCN